MANASETTGELYKANVLTKADIAAAVDAFIADPATTAFLFGDGYRIDRVAAVGPHGWSFVTVADEKATDHLTRAAVRTAILLARPEEV